MKIESIMLVVNNNIKTVLVLSHNVSLQKWQTNK